MHFQTFRVIFPPFQARDQGMPSVDTEVSCRLPLRSYIFLALGLVSLPHTTSQHHLAHHHACGAQCRALEKTTSPTKSPKRLASSRAPPSSRLESVQTPTTMERGYVMVTPHSVLSTRASSSAPSTASNARSRAACAASLQAPSPLRSRVTWSCLSASPRPRTRATA